jgi:predicted DsbA family dithiol-disulfide isomerase
MTALLTGEEFNDPGCPFGYSWEQYRRQLQWHYDTALEVELRLIGLQANAEDLNKRFSVEQMVEHWKGLAEDYGMPFNFSVQRHSATLPACTAIVAARLHGANDRALMRWLRIKRFSGEPIDDQAVIDSAAQSAGIDPAKLAVWTASGVTETALARDMDAARSPDPAALAVDHRLADSDGGRRYTCPTWELNRVSDKQRFVAAGFQPYEVYEVALANLLPDVEQRAAADDPIEVLWWAGEPLATREVALVMDIDDDKAHDALTGSAATEIPLESSSFWTQ